LGIEVLNDQGKRKQGSSWARTASVSSGRWPRSSNVTTMNKGIIWPLSVAPFQVAIVVAQSDNSDTAKVGEDLYSQLAASGVEVIIDDRLDRAGVKFRDVS